MAEYDGSVKINTRIDSDGLYEGIKKMSSKTMQLNNKISETKKQIVQVQSEMKKTQSTDMSSSVKKLNDAIKTTEESISKVNAEIDHLDNTPVMTDEYKYMNDSLEKAKMKLNQLQDKQDKLANTGKQNSASWKNLVYDIENVKREIASTASEMKDMEANDEAFTVDISAIENKQKQLDALNVKLNEYKQKLSDTKKEEASLSAISQQKKQDQIDKLNGKLKVYNRQLQEAKQKETGMTAQVGKIKQLSSALNKLAFSGKAARKGFSGIGGLLGTVGRRIGSLAMSAMLFNAISKGLTNVREELVNCLSTNAQFNSSLSQIKGNLYTAFAPIYQYALPAINALMQGLVKITGTIAVFTSKLFGNSVSKSQQTAKSLYNQAKAIDSIGSAAKKASGNLSDIDDMHILTDNKDNSNAASGGTSASAVNFEEIKTDEKLGKWLDEMKDKFQPLIDAIQRLIAAAAPLAGPFLAGFIDGLTEIITSETAVGIINDIAEILEGMDPDEVYKIGKGFGEFASAVLLIAGAVGFASFVSSLGSLWEILLPLGTFVAGWKIGTGLYELITGEDVDMTMWEELDEIFGTLFTDSETFFDGLGWMCYDAISGLTESITGEALPTWQDFKDDMKEIWDERGILGLIESAAAGFLLNMGVDSETVKEILKGADEITQKYKKAFSEGGIKGVFRKFGQDAWGIIRGLGTNVTTFFHNMINNVKTFFVNIGTNVGNSVKDAFAAAVNGIFSTIESRINGFIGAINAIRVLINKIPGVNLARVQTVSLPRLATGTVVPANYGEFQAILGDNKRAPEIVSPVPTMKQAVREVLNETGNSNKPIVIHNYVTLDGKVVYKTVVEYNNREIDMTGNSPLFA